MSCALVLAPASVRAPNAGQQEIELAASSPQGREAEVRIRWKAVVDMTRLSGRRSAHSRLRGVCASCVSLARRTQLRR